MLNPLASILLFFLIADSHFIAKPFSSVGPAWGA